MWVKERPFKNVLSFLQRYGAMGRFLVTSIETELMNKGSVYETNCDPS